MSDIVAKTILKTVLGIVGIICAVLIVMSLGFPQHMASACENVGAYNLATGYASLRYAYTGSAEDLNRCACDSILAENDGNIVKYCGSLVEDDGFEDICLANNSDKYDYRQYIYSKLAVAKYNTGDKEGALSAVDEALSGVEGFPEGNALASLATAVAEANDPETAAQLLAKLGNIAPAGDEESDYYNRVKNILKIGE